MRSDSCGISFMSAALFTRMSTPPNSSVAACTIAAAASGSVMSTRTPIASRPWAVSSAALATGAVAVEVGEHDLCARGS